jgi:uncharacterized protein involved in exopolysaccharide biosynthesis
MQLNQVCAVAHKEVNMVPLLSRRSIIVLILGLVLGVAAGFGYTAVGPSTTVYRSTATLGILGGYGSSSTRDLAADADLYLAKLNSFAFLDFFANQLIKEAPQYSHAALELDEDIIPKADYATKAGLVSSRPKIIITVQSADPDEALFLASFTPGTLEEYLRQEQNSVLLEIETVRTDLGLANQQLGNITEQMNAYDLNLKPEYIAAQNKAESLTRQLGVANDNLVSLMQTGNTSGTKYKDIQTQVNNLSIALAQVNSDLSTMETQRKADMSLLKQDYDFVDSRVTALTNRLQQLTNSLVGSSASSSDSAEATNFVQLGNTSAPIKIQTRNVPARTALGLGGLLGLGCAFVALNYKWLLGRGGSSSRPGSGHDDDDRETLYLHNHGSSEERDGTEETPEREMMKQ